MRVQQAQWSAAQGWSPPLVSTPETSAQLVLVFGASAALRTPEVLQAIRLSYPEALLLGCSTAGEICGTLVSDDSLVLTAIQFAHSQVRGAEVRIGPSASSAQAGQFLGDMLPGAVQTRDGGVTDDNLTHVLVLSDGLNVNGSELIRGLLSHLPAGVSVTGGLAGDGSRFRETLVFSSDVPQSGTVAAVGFYGHRLKIGFGSMGGWDPFGPDRLITRSEGNVLLELDGRPALGLYKQYLGEHAQGLPSTGLLFPLSMRARPGEAPVVRAVLGVDEQQQSLTFGGDLPLGALVRLSKANVESLVDGAVGAARICNDFPDAIAPSLAVLISCVGRKLVLKQRVEEEIEGVREVLGEPTVLSGFYSYGEIAPFGPGAPCELHNQTMTITTFAET